MFNVNSWFFHSIAYGLPWMEQWLPRKVLIHIFDLLPDNPGSNTVKVQKTKDLFVSWILTLFCLGDSLHSSFD